eukprot:gene6085-6325_t
MQGVSPVAMQEMPAGSADGPSPSTPNGFNPAGSEPRLLAGIDSCAMPPVEADSTMQSSLQAQQPDAGFSQQHQHHKQQKRLDNQEGEAAAPGQETSNIATADANPGEKGCVSQHEDPQDSVSPQLSAGGAISVQHIPAPGQAVPALAEPVAQPQPAGVQVPVGAYTQREEHLQRQEAAGEIEFAYVLNDGQPHNMMRLMGLKVIFSKQLPNMPKEYICRLLLDRRHRSVALLGKNGLPLGGITYRVFPQHGFGEIAFCAVAASQQVRGFGTRLMNHTKQYARDKDGLTHFLTYADNNAVGYFSKQGFTREITLPRDRWVGYIKDYDGGTLMECVIHPKIPYADLVTFFRVQKEYLDGQIRQLSNSHIVHKGIQRTKVPLLPSKYRLVLRDGSVVDPTQAKLETYMTELLSMVQALDEAWPFRRPVEDGETLDYYDIIVDPVDLSLIESRLGSKQYYISLEMFVADIRKMCDNCRYYNAQSTPYYQCASKLQAAVEQYLDTSIVEATGNAAAASTPSAAAARSNPTSGAACLASTTAVALVLILQFVVAAWAKTAYLVGSMAENNPANDSFNTLFHLLQPDSLAIYDTILLTEDYALKPQFRGLTTTLAGNVTFSSANYQTEGYKLLKLEFREGGVLIPNSVRVTFKDIALSRARKTTGQGLPLFVGQGGGATMLMQNVVRLRLVCDPDVDAVVTSLNKAAAAAGDRGLPAAAIIDYDFRGQLYKECLYAKNVSTIVTPGDNSDATLDFSGYLLTQVNVTRLCENYVDPACSASRGADACVVETVDRLLEAEAAAQHASGPGLAAIVAPAIVGGLLLLGVAAYLLWWRRRRCSSRQPHDLKQLPLQLLGGHKQQGKQEDNDGLPPSQPLQPQQLLDCESRLIMAGGGWAAVQPDAPELDDTGSSEPKSVKESAMSRGTAGSIEKLAVGDRGSGWTLAACHTCPEFSNATSSDRIKLGVLLGAGSFGRVYKGTWHGVDVAVKVLQHDSTTAAAISNEVDLGANGQEWQSGSGSRRHGRHQYRRFVGE